MDDNTQMSKEFPDMTIASVSVFRHMMVVGWGAGWNSLKVYEIIQGNGDDIDTVINPRAEIIFSIEYFESAKTHPGPEKMENQVKSFDVNSTVKSVIDWVSSVGGNMFGIIDRLEKKEESYDFIQTDIE